jgi:hypothetical protein
MYVLKKTKENGLLDDLIITGGHSILVDKLTIEEQQKQLDFNIQFDNKFLLLSKASSLFEPVTEKGKKFNWYHFCLEPEDYNYDQRFGVYANGVLVETPSENQLKPYVGIEMNNKITKNRKYIIHKKNKYK